jgi:hypothetical protein
LADLRPGIPHTLKLSLEGFRDEVVPLTVEPGKTLELRVTLKPRSDNVWATLRELTTRIEEKKSSNGAKSSRQDGGGDSKKQVGTQVSGKLDETASDAKSR